MTSRFEPAANSCRLLRASVLALIALPCLLAGPKAGAQPPVPVELTWQAPPECPSEAEVRARIQNLARARSASARRAPAVERVPMQAQAVVSRIGHGKLRLTLALRVGGLKGQRSLEGDACADLAAAAAIHIALSLRAATDAGADDSAAEAAAASPDATSDQGAAPTAAASAQASDSTEASGSAQPGARTAAVDAGPSARDPRPPRAWRAVLQAPGLSLAVGSLPEPSLGGVLAVGILVRRWYVTTNLGLWQKQQLTAADRVDVAASIGRAAVGVWACRNLVLVPLDVAACASLSLEYIWARASGALVSGRDASAGRLAAGLGAQSRVPIWPWLQLLVGVDAQVASARPQISVGSVGSLGRFGALDLKIRIATEWIL